MEIIRNNLCKSACYISYLQPHNMIAKTIYWGTYLAIDSIILILTLG